LLAFGTIPEQLLDDLFTDAGGEGLGWGVVSVDLNCILGEGTAAFLNYHRVGLTFSTESSRCCRGHERGVGCQEGAQEKHSADQRPGRQGPVVAGVLAGSEQAHGVCVFFFFFFGVL